MSFTIPVTAYMTGQGSDVAVLTGVSLAAGATGTVTESSVGGDVELPAGFDLGDVSSTIVMVNHAASPVAGTPLVSVTKSGTPFSLISITNRGATDTGLLEIYFIKAQSRA